VGPLNGFKEYDCLKWDDQYAPDNWDYEKHGRPDMVMMKRDDDPEGRKKPEQREKTPATEAFKALQREYCEYIGLEPKYGEEEEDEQ